MVRSALGLAKESTDICKQLSTAHDELRVQWDKVDALTRQINELTRAQREAEARYKVNVDRVDSLKQRSEVPSNQH